MYLSLRGGKGGRGQRDRGGGLFIVYLRRRAGPHRSILFLKPVVAPEIIITIINLSHFAERPSGERRRRATLTRVRSAYRPPPSPPPLAYPPLEFNIDGRPSVRPPGDLLRPRRFTMTRHRPKGPTRPTLANPPRPP